MSPSLDHDHYKFTGYTNSFVKFNYTGNEEWSIRFYGEYGDNSTYATIVGPDYPIGTLMWKIVSPSSNRTVEMDFNACQEDSEYNCADGACIPIDKREVEIVIYRGRISFAAGNRSQSAAISASKRNA